MTNQPHCRLLYIEGIRDPHTEYLGASEVVDACQSGTYLPSGGRRCRSVLTEPTARSVLRILAAHSPKSTTSSCKSVPPVAGTAGALPSCEEGVQCNGCEQRALMLRAYMDVTTRVPQWWRRVAVVLRALARVPVGCTYRREDGMKRMEQIVLVRRFYSTRCTIVYGVFHLFR